jgi:6-phosphofructokinase 1
MRKAYQTIKDNAINGMIVIGGNGTFAAAHQFYLQYKVPCIGIPASIDNDINGMDFTIGSDTAINTALEAIDNIRDTATSMERIFVVEVMGRGSGYIAFAVALGAGCEGVIIPEKKTNLQAMCRDIEKGNKKGKHSWIIVVAEGAGRAVDIAKKINQMTKLETRPVILGHVQRGGRPTAFSRDLALRLGQAAVDALLAGKKDLAVGWHHGKFINVGFKKATQKKKLNLSGWYKLFKVLT